MSGRLVGRKALVMAASQGLGAAVARAFAREGADVALCARRGDVVAAVAEDIAAQHGVQTYAAAVDVRDGAALAAFVANAAQNLGGLDILVTNAGGPPAGRFTDLDDEAWENAFRLNLQSVVRAVRAALPHLRQRRGASIACIVSSSVKTPIAQLVLSNALRPGIVGLAKTLSMELAGEGIRVNSVAPGRVDTERVRALDEVHARAHGRSAEEERRASEASIPMGRYGEPEEFADAVVFLASDDARYITGQTIFVDGGLVRTLY